MIKRLLQASPTVASAAFIVGFFSLLSRLAGVFRDRILTELFSKGTLDVYYQAFRLPDLLFQLLVVGALSASFIPIFTKFWKNEEQERAFKYTNNILNILLIVFGVFCLFSIVFSHQMAPLVAYGFAPDKQLAVAKLSQVLFAGQLFFAVSMVFGSVLQGTRRFLIPSLAPIIYNAGIIFGAWFFVPSVGVIGLAWGVVLGAFLHALLHAVGIFSLGYRYKPELSLTDSDVRQTFFQGLPRLFALAVNQLSFVIMTIIASSLAEGSIRNLQLSYNLNFVPIGIIAVSYAIAAYPTFCEKVAAKDEAGLRASFSLTFRQVLFFMIPSTVIFLLLRAQIVRVVYGSNGLDWESTIAIANALGLFAISFFAQASSFILVRAYYALEDTRAPLVMAIFATVLNIGLGLSLAPRYGILGLVAAFSISEMIRAALLWSYLSLHINGLDEKKVLKSLLSLSIAGFLSALGGQAVKYLIVAFVDLTTFWNVLLQLIFTSLVALGIYVLIARLFGSLELRGVVSGVQRKFIKAAEPSEIAPGAVI